jgi:uncharacterized membrane protein YkoI
MSQIISNKKKMLGFVLGMAIVAAIGTTVSVFADTSSGTNNVTASSKSIVNIPTIQGSIDINQLLMQSVKSKFVDAANTAQSAVGGGTVIGGELGPYQGYYVYNFRVLDSSDKIHLVIVDAGNGQILSNTEMPNGFSFMSGKMIGFHGISGPIGDVTYQAMNPEEGPITIQTAPSR